MHQIVAGKRKALEKDTESLLDGIIVGKTWHALFRLAFNMGLFRLHVQGSLDYRAHPIP